MSRVITTRSLVVAALAVPASAHAQGDLHASYQAMSSFEIDQEVQLLNRELAQARGSRKVDTDEEIKARNARFRNLAVTTPSIDPGQGLTAAERAALVLNTTVDGAKAGLNLSPFALTRFQALRGISLTFAGLDDGVTRFGGGYVYEHRGDPTRHALGLHCPPDIDAVRSTMDSYEDAYTNACGAVAGVDVARACVGRSRSCADAVAAGRLACDLPVTDTQLSRPRTVTAAAASITAMFTLIRDDSLPANISPAQQQGLDRLARFQLPRPLDCLSPAQIEAAVTRWIWDQHTIKASLSGHVDLFPLVFGFNPEKFEHLETKAREARIDLLYSRRGLEAGLGVGWAGERDARGGKLAGTVRPSFRISKVVAALDGGGVEDADGALRLLDGGQLPPIVVAGVQGELAYAPEAVAGDPAKLRSLTITLHVDLRFNSALAFRIGIPLEMKRIASMTNPADVGSQWSIPAFATTVLTL